MNYGKHTHIYVSGFAVLAIFLGYAAYRILTSRAAMDTFDVIFICVCVAVALAVVLGVIHIALNIRHRHEGHRIEMRARLAIVRVLENEAKATTDNQRPSIREDSDHLALLYRTAIERPVIPERRNHVLFRNSRQSRTNDVVETQKQIQPGDMA